MSSPPSFGAVDTSNCDREPIHIPGSIQPHGALIALHEPELTVFQVSDNVASFVDRGPGELLGQSLDTLLGVPRAERFRETCVGRESFLDINPIALELATRGGVRRLDGVLHRAEGLLILELEPSPKRSHDATDTYLQLARAAVRDLQVASTLEELLQRAAELIRGRAGFDRVMVYRFDRDWHGEVIAEAVREDLAPFLGLHYPASDIPAQARELYTRSWLRLIPDVGYTPVPLTPSHNPLSGAPLDLSSSILRSVSPIHLEYLRNMGVAASMSISLMKRGKLWGLIACHHQTPHPVSYELRAFAEFIAQALSWQLTSKLQLGDAERRLSSKRIQSRLIAAMAGSSSLVEGLLRAHPEEFLALGRATGGALHHEGALHTVGVVPPESEILAIIERLASGATDDLFATDVLSELHPPAAGYPSVASGLLAITLSRQNRDCLLWFRPEHAMTVTWGGDPHKAVEQGSLRLSPRKSFSAWKEHVHLHSLPFDDADLEAARDLRSAMLAVILRRASELKRLNQELNEAVLARDDFFSVASHELRTPLSTLTLQLHMLLGPAAAEGLPALQLRSRLEVADRQVKRLNQLIDLLLDVTRIRAGKLDLRLEDGIDLGAVIREVAGGMELERQRFRCPLELQLAEGVKGRWDAQRLDQVVTNLLSNAFKYGDQKKVTVTLTSEQARRSGQGVARLAVRDEGIGMTPEEVSRIFQRFERAGVVREYTTGLGLGLWITEQIVLRLGGAIETQSTPKRGSTFIVTLPLAGPVE